MRLRVSCATCASTPGTSAAPVTLMVVAPKPYIDGFSLLATVRCEAENLKRLEQLCRYSARPALVDERVQVNAAGQVELKLKTPWRDGPAGRDRPVARPFARLSTTHLVMSPLEFVHRPAALWPRPRRWMRRCRWQGWRTDAGDAG